MDLETFVAETLRQIVAGVVRAQKDTHDLGARIYPHVEVTHASEMRFGEDAEAKLRPVYDVAFDVAVTVNKSKGTNAEMKARLHVVEAGFGGKSASESVTVSRVSFSLPIVYPWHRTPPLSDTRA